MYRKDLSEKQCLTGILDIDMIEDYVLSGFFIAHFSVCGCTFSSQLITLLFLFQLSMLRFSVWLFMLQISAQLSHFKRYHPAFQCMPEGKSGLILFTLGAFGQQLPFYSSNWGPKSKTQVSYWWSCISLFAHMFSVKTSTHSPTIHSSTYILQRENSFCLASDP